MDVGSRRDERGSAIDIHGLRGVSKGDRSSRVDPADNISSDAGLSGSFYDRSFLQYDRGNERNAERRSGRGAGVSWRKSDVVSWVPDQDLDLSTSYIQRQESFLDRIRRVKSTAPGDENEGPFDTNRISNISAKFRPQSFSKKPKRKPLHFESEDLLTEEQAAKIRFTYGDDQLDIGFSMKRKAVQNVRSYIAEIRVPVSDQSWSLILSSLDFRCLRGQEMEHPGSGEYANFARLRDLYGHDGVFRCRGCRNFLFLPGDFLDEGFPWATFRTALPTAVNIQRSSRSDAEVNYLCQRCNGFIGRHSHSGCIFVCSRSIYYQPMTKDEEELVNRAYRRKKNRMENRK